jgi:hypothetical protein
MRLHRSAPFLALVAAALALAAPAIAHADCVADHVDWANQPTSAGVSRWLEGQLTLIADEGQWVGVGTTSVMLVPSGRGFVQTQARMAFSSRTFCREVLGGGICDWQFFDKNTVDQVYVSLSAHGSFLQLGIWGQWFAADSPVCVHDNTVAYRIGGSTLLLTLRDMQSDLR